mmetsp:Transcript_21136/g.33200  ORF Transcript_21136/g.33200 Transcript_21136/m.33200 type:complete len:82 (-) Transcript_21136:688-933(-)
MKQYSQPSNNQYKVASYFFSAPTATVSFYHQKTLFSSLELLSSRHLRQLYSVLSPISKICRSLTLRKKRSGKVLLFRGMTR